MKKLSSSFAAGAIALVFAVLGYQTALLVHRSATARIIANRDSPDTVYVYGAALPQTPLPQTPLPQTPLLESPPQGERPAGAGQAGKRPEWTGPGWTGLVGTRTQRKNAPHSPRASAIWEKSRPGRVENFRFNPNECSVEDLVRLGFTPKQAASIDAYRSKGGRFRRKEDFARSYVVSDSVYARLESYIDIPLTDINKADSAAFDSLPGIGGWYARRIIEHRRRLRGFSYPEQLMDIRGFDEQKYAALADLVCLSEPEAFALWSLPADSLKTHPYIAGAAKARSIVFFREHNPRDKWTVEELARAGILTAEEATKLGRCRLERPSESSDEP